jgi:DTW domain-containing protein YfiP
MTPIPRKRLACTICLRPQSACICRWVTPVEHPVEVLILQHPLEVDNPKGTARLLHLSLPGSRLVTGEVFDDLPALLADPPGTGGAPGSAKLNLLLYPDTPQNQKPALRPGSLRRATWTILSDCGWWYWTAPGARASRCCTPTRCCSNCRAWHCRTSGRRIT